METAQEAGLRGVMPLIDRIIELAKEAPQRTLDVGDRLIAQPCIVTVTSVGDTTARADCDTCCITHVLDRRLYEAGRGPWWS
jgi:hypothetical protein